MEKNFKDASRGSWSAPNGQEPSIEGLQLGALQRIADALEKIAEMQKELVRDGIEAKRLRRQVNALRGRITRLTKDAAPA